MREEQLFFLGNYWYNDYTCRLFNKFCRYHFANEFREQRRS